MVGCFHDIHTNRNPFRCKKWRTFWASLFKQLMDCGWLWTPNNWGIFGCVSIFIHLASLITAFKFDVESCFSKTTKLNRLYNFKVHSPNVPDPIHVFSSSGVNSFGQMLLTSETEFDFSALTFIAICKKVYKKILMWKIKSLNKMQNWFVPNWNIFIIIYFDIFVCISLK